MRPRMPAAAASITRQTEPGPEHALVVRVGKLGASAAQRTRILAADGAGEEI